MLQEHTNPQPKSATYFELFKSKAKSATITASGYAGGTAAVTYVAPAAAASFFGYVSIPVAIGAVILAETVGPRVFAPVYWVGSAIAKGVTTAALNLSSGSAESVYMPKPPESLAMVETYYILETEEDDDDVELVSTIHPLDNSLRI